MRSIVKPYRKIARFSCCNRIYDIFFSQFLLHFTCGHVKLSTITAKAAKMENGIAARAAKTEKQIAVHAENSKARISAKAAKKEANNDPKSVCSRIPLL